MMMSQATITRTHPLLLCCFTGCQGYVHHSLQALLSLHLVRCRSKLLSEVSSTSLTRPINSSLHNWKQRYQQPILSQSSRSLFPERPFALAAH